MKKTALRYALVLWGIAAAALADEPVFQFYKELTHSALQQEELLAITLDADVYGSTHDGLPDLRLLDQQRTPIPYLLRKVRTIRARTVRNTWPGRQPSARPLDDGGLEIILQLDRDDPQPGGIRIISPLRNFEHRVRVYTSTDAQQWEPTGSAAVIFDYSRFMDVRSDTVSFPETEQRHFRIVIDSVTAEQESELLSLTRHLRGSEETGRQERITINRRPFRIDRIEFWRDVERQRATGEKKTEYPVSEIRVEEDPEEQQTIIQVDTRREPLTSLELETPSRNFSRRAVVEVEETRGVKTTWRKIGEGTFSRIDFKSLKQERLSIAFSESRQARYRVVIDNRDSPPLEVTGIKAKGNVHELVFMAAPDKSYRLAYGYVDEETDTKPASYDTAAVQELLRKGFQPARAELSKQQTSLAAGQPPTFRWSRLINDSRLLVGVILLLVIALGWGLYRAVKRMDNLPTE